MFNNYPDVMTVKQVAHALRIGANKAYELVNKKTINSIKIGRKIIIPKIFLIEYIESFSYNENA